MNDQSIRKFLLFLLCIGSGIMFSGCDQPAAGDETEDPAAAVPDEEAAVSTPEYDAVVWQVYDDSLAEIWEEPLNELLASKGASYQVKIEAYGNILEGAADTYVSLLTALKDESSQADLISLPPAMIEDTGTGYQYQFPYSDAAAAGLLAPLDEYMETAEGERIAQCIHPNDLSGSVINGTRYGLAQHMRAVTATVYNKDYLEKYKIDSSDLSADLAASQDMIQMVTGRETGEVYYISDGIRDSSGCWMINASLALAFNPEDYSMQNMFATEAMAEYFEKLYELQETGLAISGNADTADFFARTDYVYNNEVYETTYTYKDVSDNIETVEVVVVPDMSTPSVDLYWGDAATGIASWSERADDAFDFLTLLYTDADIANLIQYGIEGVHHTIAADGTVAYTEAGWRLANIGEEFTNPLLTMSTADMAADKREYIDAYYEAVHEDMPYGFRLDTSEIEAELYAVDSFLETSELAGNLITGLSEDIEGDLEKINEQLRQKGIETITAEAGRQLEEWEGE